MQALVYTQPNEVQLLERDAPVGADGEVVVRIDAVGICGSDLHAYHGHDPRRKPGLVLGHEFAGTVIESASKGWAVGRRVTGNPLITCGRCDPCVQGRDNLCEQRTMVGMTRPGAFAQRMSIPGQCLIEVPDTPEPGGRGADRARGHRAACDQPECTRHAPPAARGPRAGAGRRCDRHAQRAAAAPPGRRPAGGGRGESRCDASRWPGTHAASPSTRASVRPTTARFELVIDAVGSAATRTAALAAVRPGGVVMHIGLQDWASEIDMRKLTLAEITLLGTYTYSMADLRATVAALARGVFGDLSWVERRPLAQGAQAFDDLHHGRVASAKVVLEPVH